MAGEQTSLGKLVVDLLLKDDQFQSAMANAQTSMQSGGANLQQTANRAGQAITSAFKAAAAAVTAFGAASTVVGANFEQQMAMVGALQGLQQTDQAFQDLQGQARLLGSTTEFTATQAAGALEELARAGATVEESIQSSNSALVLAGTSASSLADSTQLLVATQRQFGLEAAESERITNVFSQAMRNSLLDFASIREAMKFAGTAGASFGMTLEETTAAVAAFRDLGLEGSLAGTNFRMAMIAASKGTQQQAAALQKYGLTLADINPETNKFADIVETIGEVGITASDAVAIFGSRAGANIAQLAAQTAKGEVNMRAFTSTLMDASKEGNTAADMYKTIGQTVAFQSKIVISAMQDLMIEVFDTFAGPLQDLISTIPEVLNAVTAAVKTQSAGLRDTFSDTLGAIGAFMRDNAKGLADAFVNTMKTIASLGPVLVHIADLLIMVAKNADIVMGALAFGAAAFTAFKLVSAVNGLAIAFGAASAATTAFGVTLTVTTGGLFAAVAAAGALVAGLGVLISNIASARSETEALGEAQEKLAGEQEALAATLEGELTPVLERQQRLANERLRTENDLSDAEVERLERIKNLTVAEAARLELEGKLIRTGGELREVGELVNKMGDDAIGFIDGQASALDAEVEAIDTKVAALERLAASASASNSESFRSAELAKAAVLLGVDEIATAQELTERIRAEGQQRETSAARATALRNQVASAAQGASKQEVAAAFDAQREINAAKSMGATEEVATSKAKTDKLLALEQRLVQDLLRIQGDEEALRRAALRRREDEIVAAAKEQVKDAEGDAKAIEQIKTRRDRAIDAANDLFNMQQKQAAKDLADREIAEAQRASDEIAQQKQAANDLLLNLGVRHVGRWERLATDQQHVLATLQHESVDVQVAALEALNKAYKRDTVRAIGQAAKATVDFGKKAAASATAALDAVGGMVEEFSGFNFDLREGVQAVIDLQDEALDAQVSAQEAVADAQERMAEAQASGDRAAMEQAADDLAAARAALADADSAIAGGGAGFAAEFVQGLIAESVRFAEMFAESAGPLLEQLAAGIPDVMAAVAAAIPAVFNALAEQLPVILQSIVDALPTIVPALVAGITQVVVAVFEALPGLIAVLLGEVLPALIVQLTSSIPQIITAAVEAIPQIILAVVEALPAILFALIDMIPMLIEGIITALPTLIAGIIAVLPQLIVAIIDGLLKEFVLALPRIVGQLWAAVVNSAKDAVMSIAEAIWDALTGFINIFKKKNKGDKKGGKSAFSGISYVPATMRMTVHKGEAVIDAARNAQVSDATAPAPAGAAQNGMGGGGSEQPIDIAVMAEGRLLDAVMVQATRRGGAVGIQREIRRASGVRVGLDRGRFNPWSK
jgi:TP901 family phage tail tape measure protein